MINRLHKKWIFATLLSLLLCFIIVPSSFAVEIFEDETVIIKAGEVIEDDLMVFANELIMDGTVEGDLLVFANRAKINGLVEGDVLGVAQEIVINGTVADDVRIADMVLTLGEAAQIGDDLLAGAYSFETKAGSLVEGDMLLGVGQSRLAGDVAGDLWMSGGGLELLGTVAGDVQADVGSAADAPVFPPFTFVPDAPQVPTVAWGLTLGEEAAIGGDFTYTAPIAVEIPTAAVDGQVAFDQVVPVTAEEEVVTPQQRTFIWLGDFFRQLITLLVIGLLMVWIAPHWTNKVAYYVQDKPLPNLGWGLLAIAVLLLAIVLTVAVMIMVAILLGALTFADLVSAVVIFGLFVTFGLILLFAFTVAYFTKIIVSVAVGRFLFMRFNSRFAESGYWSMALGVFLIVLFTAIPYIGGLLSLIVTILGFGALWMEGRKGWQDRLTWHTDDSMVEMKVKPA